MKNIEINQTVDLPEHEYREKNHVQTWLHILGNETAWLQAIKDPDNPKFLKLVETLNADPIFKALDTIYGRDAGLDPTSIGHVGLEKQFDEKYANIAQRIYGAQWWVKALKTFGMEETPEEQLTRKERKQFLTEPFADQALAGAIQVEPWEVDKLTLDAQNFLWVLFGLGQRKLAQKIGHDPNLFENADIHEAFEELNKQADVWEQLRAEWTVLALGIKPDRLPFGDFHTFGKITNAWRMGKLRVEGEHQLQWTNGEDQKEGIWAKAYICDEGFGKTKKAPWFDKLEKLKVVIKP